jgi:hypothetical protein
VPEAVRREGPLSDSANATTARGAQGILPIALYICRVLQ